MVPAIGEPLEEDPVRPAPFVPKGCLRQTDPIIPSPDLVGTLSPSDLSGESAGGSRFLTWENTDRRASACLSAWWER